MLRCIVCCFFMLKMCPCALATIAESYGEPCGKQVLFNLRKDPQFRAPFYFYAKLSQDFAESHKTAKDLQSIQRVLSLTKRFLTQVERANSEKEMINPFHHYLSELEKVHDRVMSMEVTDCHCKNMKCNFAAFYSCLGSLQV